MKGSAKDALDGFYTRARLRRLLYRIGRAVGFSNNPEDLLQSAIVRLEKHRVNGDVQNPEAFLVTAAIRIAKDEGRRKTSRPDVLRPLSELLDIAASDPSQHEVICARQRLAEVQAIIDRMPSRTRYVLMRRRVDGLPYRVIAEELGITVSAVEKHVARAALALAQVDRDD